MQQIGEPRLDPEGNPITVTGLTPEDIVTRVFLTKPDKRKNVKRAQVMKLIKKFNDDLEFDLTQCQLKIALKVVIVALKILCPTMIS